MAVGLVRWRGVLGDDEFNPRIKIAAAKAAAFLVYVESGNSSGCIPGVVFECEEDVSTHQFHSIIIVPASLSVPNLRPQSHPFYVDVHLPDGQLFPAELVACDPHFNLAAFRIVTHFPLPTPPLREINDVVPLFDSLQSRPQTPFCLLPHSSLFNISPGTELIILGCHSLGSKGLKFLRVVFRAIGYPFESNCNELYWVKECESSALTPSYYRVRPRLAYDGGIVINCLGEVIGILFRDSPFLPINIISRWWNNFKSCGKYRRPWTGMEFANLHSSRVEVLEEFMRKFPSIFAGVLVTKVAKDSPAYSSGIHAKDVIVKCDGKPVQSKLEFFASIWNKVGESVELNVLRPSTGDQLMLSLTVEEATPENFYEWWLPPWNKPVSEDTMHKTDDVSKAKSRKRKVTHAHKTAKKYLSKKRSAKKYFGKLSSVMFR